MMLLFFCNLAPFPQSSSIGENKKLGQVFLEEKLRQCLLSDLGYTLARKTFKEVARLNNFRRLHKG
jgi:hypothetical protein